MDVVGWIISMPLEAFDDATVDTLFYKLKEKDSRDARRSIIAPELSNEDEVYTKEPSQLGLPATALPQEAEEDTGERSLAEQSPPLDAT